MPRSFDGVGNPRSTSYHISWASTSEASCFLIIRIRADIVALQLMADGGISIPLNRLKQLQHPEAKNASLNGLKSAPNLFRNGMVAEVRHGLGETSREDGWGKRVDDHSRLAAHVCSKDHSKESRNISQGLISRCMQLLLTGAWLASLVATLPGCRGGSGKVALTSA